MTNEEQAFLADLATLTKKHKIYIGGCGCCGSPYLGTLEDNELTGEYKLGHSEKLSWEYEDADA